MKRKLTEIQNTNSSNAQHPAAFVLKKFKANGLDSAKASDESLLPFLKISEDMIDAFTMDAITAVRKNDIDHLRKMHESGKSLQCCNKFGESLIHMACRRGQTDMVRFLIRDANVSLLVKDDFGRTPLHDALWTPAPRYDLVELIVNEIPELLCVPDVRGHSPLDYVRKSNWEDWVKFFERRSDLLRATTSCAGSHASAAATTVPAQAPEIKQE